MWPRTQYSLSARALPTAEESLFWPGWQGSQARRLAGLQVVAIIQ